jgi:hypothetical protein
MEEKLLSVVDQTCSELVFMEEGDYPWMQDTLGQTNLESPGAI